MFFNPEKKMCELLKANEGSKLSYDSQAKEFVITFTGHDGFRIPSDCEFSGEHIFKENSNQVICRVKRE